MNTIAMGLLWYWAFLFSTIAHEAAHAWAALKLGDDTAYKSGQVSMNPLPHIIREPFGTVFVPIVTLFTGGWMMGWASTPYDPQWAQRYPRRTAWMALAGPVANLVIAIVAGLMIWLGIWAEVFIPPSSASFTEIAVTTVPDGWWQGAATLLSIVFSLNILLFVFNLIPIAPLDGGAVVTLLMSKKLAEQYRNLMGDPLLPLFGLMVAWHISGPLVTPILGLALHLLYPGDF